MKKALILLITFISVTVSAQKYELGKVTIDELKEKQHSVDTSAAAAVLFKKGVTTFDYSYGQGFSIVTEVITKIKIYKKEGVDLANQNIRFYDYNKLKEKVIFTDAVSYNLSDGKIVKSKLKTEGEFDEKINKYWKRKKIAMPDVKVGTIIEFKYRLSSPIYSEFRDWVFQDEIPVNYSEYQTKIPEYFVYNIHNKGSLVPKIENNSFESTFSGTYQEMANQSGGFRSERGTYEIKYRLNINKYSSSNIPALRNEGYVNNIDNYTSSIVFELSTVKMPNEGFTNYATDWGSVTKKIYENDDFGAELNKTGYFESDILNIISKYSDKREKIAAIFNYVKSNIKWNNYRGYTCDEGVKVAYKNKVGNVAEINLMLTAMLRYAGLDANPVLLSTRDNGIAFYPSREAFNYVISGVEVENDIYLMDATNLYSEPNILPLNDLNWFGRMIKKDGSSKEINLNSKMISKDIVRLMASIDAKGEITGKINEQYTDYNGFVFRDNYNAVSEESYLEKLEKKYKGIEITDYKVENKLQLGTPIIETYSFKNTNSIETIGDKMYFSPLLFLAQTENPFKQEKREYPVDFTFVNQDRSLFVFEIPEGYTIETMPAPINLVFSDDSMSFKFNISNNGRQINVSSIFEVKTSIVAPGDYEELKAFYNEMIKKQTEKIVLKKV